MGMCMCFYHFIITNAWVILKIIANHEHHIYRFKNIQWSPKWNSRVYVALFYVCMILHSFSENKKAKQLYCVRKSSKTSIHFKYIKSNTYKSNKSCLLRTRIVFKYNFKKNNQIFVLSILWKIGVNESTRSNILTPSFCFSQNKK